MNLRKGIAYAKTARGIMNGGRAFGPPLEVNISLSNRCNLRCIHCYFHSPEIEKSNLFKQRMKSGENLASVKDREWKDADAEPERVKNVIGRLGALGTQRFLFSGNGEPMIHPQFMTFAGLVKEKGARSILNTNGLLLTPDASSALVEMGFDELRVTTMAGDPETYTATHPGTTEKTFAGLEQNLRFLAEKKAALGTVKPKIVLVSIIIKQNSGGLENFVRFAAGVKADKVMFRPLSDVGDSGLARLAPDAVQLENVRRQVLEARFFLDGLKMSHNINYYLRVFRERLDTSALYHHIPCSYPWLSVRIEMNGLVFPCCRSYLPLGNCFEEDIADIWFGEKYNTIRREASRIHKKNKPVTGCDCANCPHYTANLRVFKMLHPRQGRSSRFNHIPFCREKEERMDMGEY